MEFYLNNDKIKDKSITREKLSDNVQDILNSISYVDAELNGDVLTVTNKNNEKKSVNLVDNYEKVTV